ncbi:MAG: type II secretion system protein [Patescibacteria group bacterium]|jgi:type II secretory pathway pseudopilin PulG
MSLTNSHKGQSLMEMIAAIAILLIVVTAILALTISNIVGQKESEFQVLANNLAREGIEAVRDIRDSNWLGGQAWDTGLQSGEAIVDFIKAENHWQLDSTSCSGNDLLYFDPASGFYSHDSDGQNSSFSRCLDLSSICLDSDGNEYIVADNACNSDDQKIGLKVEAKVTWLERGKHREVQLDDLIYDWR